MCELSGAVRMQTASFTTNSMVQLAHCTIHVIPRDGIVLCPCVFGYGRFVHEAFDACVLMLLQICSLSMLRLANVHLSHIHSTYC